MARLNVSYLRSSMAGDNPLMATSWSPFMEVEQGGRQILACQDKNNPTAHEVDYHCGQTSDAIELISYGAIDLRLQDRNT